MKYLMMLFLVWHAEYFSMCPWGKGMLSAPAEDQAIWRLEELNHKYKSYKIIPCNVDRDEVLSVYLIYSTEN